MGFYQAVSFVMLAVFPAVLLAGQQAGHVPASIPEPTDLALFGMAIAGLLIGRRAAQRRDDDR